MINLYFSLGRPVLPVRVQVEVFADQRRDGAARNVLGEIIA